MRCNEEYNIMEVTIYIDEYGKEIEQEFHVYKILLNGSKSYCILGNHYKYGIKTIEPIIPLSYFYSQKEYF